METLSKEIGEICAEATQLLYDKTKNGFEINDTFMLALDSGRKEIFSKLLPKLKELAAMDDEQADNCRSLAAISYMELLPDLENMAEELESVLENLDEDTDEDLILNIQSLYMILAFLDPAEMEGFAPHILAHVGY